jgi:myosin-3
LFQLSLEIKSFIENVSRVELPKDESEVTVIENFYKRGVEGDWEDMYVEDLASLDKISEKNVMKLLEDRMKVGQFQTFVGDVLLVLNPNEKKNIFGEQVRLQP